MRFASIVMLLVPACAADVCPLQIIDPPSGSSVLAGVAAPSLSGTTVDVPRRRVECRVCGADAAILDMETLELRSRDVYERPTFISNPEATYERGPDGTIYVTYPHGLFAAYTPDGVERWKHQDEDVLEVIPTIESAYVHHTGGWTVYALDGAVRWRRTEHTRLEPDGAGGAYVSTVAGATATIAHLDATGTAISTITAVASVSIDRPLVRVLPDAGVMIAGRVEGQLEVGDGESFLLPYGSVYAVRLDAAGTRVWTSAVVDSHYDGEVTGAVVDGESLIVVTEDHDDSRIYRFGGPGTAGGGIELTGTGAQRVTAVIPVGGARAILEVSSFDTGSVYPSKLRVNDKELGVDEGYGVDYLLHVQL